MNSALRRVGLVMVWLAPILLLANLTYVQTWWSISLKNDHRNQRVMQAEYAKQRGQISAGGELLASSDPTQDRFRYLRRYPNPLLYAPVTGFYSVLYNSWGLENEEQSVLNGTDERLFSQRIWDFLTNHSQRGGSVETTIDPRLQQVAYDKMTAACPGGCHGSVVALDPNTGAILAMTSTPSYDPNQLASHDIDAVKNYWAALHDDPAKPLLDRAIQETYPPGSTFKVVTTAAALSAGVSTDAPLTAAGSIVLPGSGQTLTNYDGAPCPDAVDGKVTLRQAFAHSCNTAFVQLMTELVPNGQSVLRGMETQLHIGPAQYIPMEVAPSQPGAFTDLAVLGQSAIGQRDVKLTPLQNAEIAASIANGGYLYQPHLVAQEFGPDLKPLGPDLRRQAPTGSAMKPEIAKQVADLMVEAERQARGPGQDPRLRIASKTGTAQDPAHGENPDTWYIAFAPANRPQIAIAVLVEGSAALGPKATGARVAAPIGRAVLAQALADRGLVK